MTLMKFMAAASAVAIAAGSSAFAQTSPATPAAPVAAATPAAQADVVETLKSSGQFNTLVKAIEAAELTATLKGAGAITILAPTDQAFAALPAGTVEEWLKPENKEQLRQTLLYHTINASVASSQITGRKGAIQTGAATGMKVMLDGSGAALKADEATIVQADIKAANGAVFAIDKVLTPQAQG